MHEDGTKRTCFVRQRDRWHRAKRGRASLMSQLLSSASDRWHGSAVEGSCGHAARVKAPLAALGAFTRAACPTTHRGTRCQQASLDEAALSSCRLRKLRDSVLNRGSLRTIIRPTAGVPAAVDLAGESSCLRFSVVIPLAPYAPDLISQFTLRSSTDASGPTRPRLVETRPRFSQRGAAVDSRRARPRRRPGNH